MYHGVERDLRKVRNCGKIPPFEVTLRREQKGFLPIGGSSSRSKRLRILPTCHLVTCRPKRGIPGFKGKYPQKCSRWRGRWGGRAKHGISTEASPLDLYTQITPKSRQRLTNWCVCFIREVQYPIWLVNVVLVKKKIGQIRICIDFRDLHRAYPKNDF